jgi:ribonucleoside-triphosphate reductase
MLSFWSDLVSAAPPRLSLPVLCLLLFVDNATISSFTTPMLLAYAPHFEPWKVGVFGALAAGAGSTVQIMIFRWILASPWPWTRRFAPSRERVARIVAQSPSASFLAILLARATPLPDGPIKLVVAAAHYPLSRYFVAVLLGGMPYFALLAWLGHEFPVPPWVLLLVIVLIGLVYLVERWRKLGRKDLA